MTQSFTQFTESFCYVRFYKFWKGYLMNRHSSVLYFKLVWGVFTADTATKLIERVSGPQEPKVPMAMKTILTYNKQQSQRIRK